MKYLLHYMYSLTGWFWGGMVVDGECTIIDGLIHLVLYWMVVGLYVAFNRKSINHKEEVV